VQELPTVLFVTFADGSPEFIDAGERLSLQAKRFGFFTKIIVLNHASLKLHSPDYSKLEMSDLAKSERLYYRASKAWVIKESLTGTFGKFDLVMYADAGCELLSNFWTKRQLRRMFCKSILSGGLAEKTHLEERCWTKLELFEYLGTPDSHRLSGQIQSTWSILHCNSSNLDLAENWCELSKPELKLWQAELYDPKIQYSNFVEHRHDQSIFSLLWKKNDLPTQKLRSEWSYKLGKFRKAGNPIHTIRNRTGGSNIEVYQDNQWLALISILLNLFLGLHLMYKLKELIKKVIKL
jgi:hypothetical protein